MTPIKQLSAHQERAVREWLLNAETAFDAFQRVFEEISLGVVVTVEQAIRFSASARELAEQAAEFAALITPDSAPGAR